MGKFFFFKWYYKFVIGFIFIVYNVLIEYIWEYNIGVNIYDDFKVVNLFFLENLIGMYVEFIYFFCNFFYFVLGISVKVDLEMFWLNLD